MWYVISECVPGTCAWYGAYKEEVTADEVAKKVNGVVLKIKDWKMYAQIMNDTNPLVKKYSL